MRRKQSAWNLVDEVLTEMSDLNFSNWATDRIKFRDIFIQEIKEYIREEDLEIIGEMPEEREW
jgi:hypothetical protein